MSRSPAIGALGAGVTLAVALCGCAAPIEHEPVAPPRVTPGHDRAPAQLDLPAPDPRASQPELPAAAEPPLAVEQPIPAPPDADVGAVTALLAAQYVAFGARDWAAFEAGFWPGGTIVTIRVPPDGSADMVVSTPVDEYVAENVQHAGNAVQIDVTMSEPEIEFAGVVAHALVKFSAQTIEPAELHRWHGTDAFLFIRHADQWRIACMAFGSPAFDD